jgi:hypothetical protein
VADLCFFIVSASSRLGADFYFAACLFAAASGNATLTGHLHERV